MLLLMVIGVLITGVMSNIVSFSYTRLQHRVKPIGIYAIPLAIVSSLSFMFSMADPTVALAYGQVT